MPASSYKCYYPGCNKSHENPITPSNHQQTCGKDAGKILKRCIKRHKLENANHAKECSHELDTQYSISGGGESSQVPASPHMAMDSDSEPEMEEIGQLEDIQADRPMPEPPPLQVSWLRRQCLIGIYKFEPTET
jgi:hypothetical protein